MKLFYISALFIGLILTGCGGTAPKPVKKELTPTWVTSILPNDTDVQMFGMAIGKNRETAIKAALVDMISKLDTTIESTFQSIQKEESSYYSESSINSIKSSISKIKINNYKVIKSFRISYNEFAVLIETDKQKFITGLKDSLLVQKQSIKEKYNALKDSDSISRYNVKKELAKLSGELLPMILILSELDNSFDKKSNIRFILSYYNY